MVGLIQRRAEYGHDGIADIFVQEPVVLEDDVRHRRQILVEKMDQLLRRQALRNRCKPLDIGEEHRERFLVAA